jgi:hypothetical protein
MPMRRLLAPLALSACLLSGVAACDSASKPTTPTSTTIKEVGLNPDRAAVLAGLLKRNFDASGATFVATVPYGPAATFVLTGSIDYTKGTASAILRSEVVGEPPVETKIFWTPEVVAEELEGLTEAMETRGRPGIKYLARAITQNSAQDIVLQFINKTGSNQAENPQLLLQGDTAYQGLDNVAGVDVEVYRFKTTRYFVRATDGVLMRIEAQIKVAEGTTVVEFSSHGPVTVTSPLRSEVIDASEVPEDVLNALTTRPSAGATATAGPQLPTTTTVAVTSTSKKP